MRREGAPAARPARARWRRPGFRKPDGRAHNRRLFLSSSRRGRRGAARSGCDRGTSSSASGSSPARCTMALRPYFPLLVSTTCLVVASSQIRFALERQETPLRPKVHRVDGLRRQLAHFRGVRRSDRLRGHLDSIIDKNHRHNVSSITERLRDRSRSCQARDRRPRCARAHQSSL